MPCETMLKTSTKKKRDGRERESKEQSQVPDSLEDPLWAFSDKWIFGKGEQGHKERRRKSVKETDKRSL